MRLVLLSKYRITKTGEVGILRSVADIYCTIQLPDGRRKLVKPSGLRRPARPRPPTNKQRWAEVRRRAKANGLTIEDALEALEE